MDEITLLSGGFNDTIAFLYALGYITVLAGFGYLMSKYGNV